MGGVTLLQVGMHGSASCFLSIFYVAPSLSGPPQNPCLQLEHLTEVGNREAGPWFNSFRLSVEASSHAPVACPTNTQRLEAASEAGLDPTKQGYLVGGLLLGSQQGSR